MTEKEKLSMLEDTLDIEEGTIKPEMKLADIDEYDSFARLSLIVMMDEEFGINVMPETIKKLVKVSDILALMEKND